MAADKQPLASLAETKSVSESPGVRWSAEAGWTALSERLSVEAPLAIEIAYERHGLEVRQVLAVTMRTPGEDEDLALGFLVAEGVIEGLAEVRSGGASAENAKGEKVDTWTVRLAREPREESRGVRRGLLTSSACGLCSRTTLEGLPLRPAPETSKAPALACTTVLSLPGRLRRAQKGFAETGGCHGAALFTLGGELLLTREDVGRHNAVDKLVGAALLKGLAPAGNLLALSGRASFELVQKASASRLAAVAAVGAPSSLAVRLAHEAGITLIGFLREGRFNVYTHAGRLASEPLAAPFAGHAGA